LAAQNVVWSEFRYRAGSEIFGEAEPADYVYQIRQGAVRTYKLLSDGRRQIGAFHLPGDIFGIQEDEFHRFTAEAIMATTVYDAAERKPRTGAGWAGLSIAQRLAVGTASATITPTPA
jgi:CRP/FNR family nitrogen fixation transcriptional regulator